MARQYNFIYNELVEDDNDIVGHIAYSLYKSDKIDFIEDYKNKNHGNEPTEDDLRRFHEVCCIPSNIERYKMQAVSILQQFMSDTLASTTKQIEEDYKNSQDKHLVEIISPIKPKVWYGIWQSIVGAFIFAVIVAAFAFINSYSASDINISFGKKDRTTIPDTTKVVTMDNEVNNK